MNWRQFKTYLETNIIETNDESWNLTESAITKYLGATPNISQKHELELTLVRLIFSLQGTLNNLPKFHHLPAYQASKTWEQLIPTNIALGAVKGEEVEILEPAIYNLLANIFRDWQEEPLEEQWEEEPFEEPNLPQELGKETRHDELNWSKFRDWLEENLFEYDGTIRAAVKTKYHINNPDKLITTIDNLIASTKHEDNCYRLPYFCSSHTNWKGEADPQVKTWEELFPIREKVRFGKRTERAVIDNQTFNILAQMHSDFVRPTKLAEQLDEDNHLTKFMMEAIVHLNFNLIKQKGYDQLLTNWLSEYTKLTEQEQKALRKPKAMVEHFFNVIATEKLNQQEQSSYWAKVKQNSYTIAWIGGGILLIIFAWRFISSKIK